MLEDIPQPLPDPSRRPGHHSHRRAPPVSDRFPLYTTSPKVCNIAQISFSLFLLRFEINYAYSEVVPPEDRNA